MAKKLKMNAMIREAKKEKPQHLRKQGMIPAIIYGKGSESISIKLDVREFFKTFHGHVAENILIDISFKEDSEKSKTVIIKDFQKNPTKNEVMHIDFIEIHAGEKLSTHIPIHLKGKSAGIAKGGILEHSLRELYIECLPKDIPADIVVNISELELGNSIHVKDLNIDPSVRVLTPEDTTIVAVAVLKKVEEVAEVAEEVAAEGSAEPEVIKKEKAEEVSK